MAARKAFTKLPGQSSQLIDGTKLSLEDWLGLIFSPDATRCIPRHYFPTEAMRIAYLKSIEARPEKEVINLVRQFLTHTGGPTEVQVASWRYAQQLQPEEFERCLDGDEYMRRFVRGEDVWEGITWIIDLLHRSPAKAATVLWAYFEANMGYFEDARIHAHDDALALIRAKFVRRRHPQQVFLDLSSRDFELLVSALYKEMGYKTQLTPPRNDGGRDVIAERRRSGQREKIYIECKRWESPVGRPILNKLFGVVQRDHFSRGVVVTCSDFSGPAKAWAKDIPTLELINMKTLSEMLNRYFGPQWPIQIESYLRSAV